MNQMRKQIEDFNASRAMESINFKVAIILVIIIVGLASNGLRSYLDLTGDKRQKRIEFLDKRVEELVQRNRALREQLEACESGTPMPEINK